MPLSFDKPPESLCILRLSAIGDVTHVLPIVRTLQNVWPSTKITWIIGKAEAALVSDIKKSSLSSLIKVTAGWLIENYIRHCQGGDLMFYCTCRQHCAPTLPAW